MDFLNVDVPVESDEDKPNLSRPYDPQRESELLHELQDTVQNPPPGLITYADLQWIPHSTTGNGLFIDSEIATIPWKRLEDFVQGQERNSEFPTTFKRKVQKRNLPGSLAKPRASSPALVIRYQCCFGPEDHSNIVLQSVATLLDNTIEKRRQSTAQNTVKKRGKKVVPEYDVFPTTRPQKPKTTRIGKKQTGRSIKRGCLCCFFAKQPYREHSICQLIYRNSKHLNREGQVVHGITVPGFKDSLGSTLSEGMKQHITNLLWLGLSPSQVMTQHKRFVKDMATVNGKVTRDTFVLPQDVRNLAKFKDEALWQKHSSDPKSVRMWVEENPESVFCYRLHGLLDLNETKQDDTPFTLGIQSPWQLQMLVKFGHKSALSFDATFGTSETRYPLYTVMVFDEWRNGIPVAFFVISQCREKDLLFVLLELQKRVQEVQLNWTPAALIVDNAQAEINVLRTIWPECKIFLCLWHVRKSWRENAVKKITTIGERAQVLQALGNIMYGTGLTVEDDPIQWAQNQVDILIAERPKAAKFLKYFKKHWYAKAPMWCVSSRTIPHAGQNTNAAIESYHGNLKAILRSSRERFDGRRLDWLIFHLLGDVVTHYWYAVQCKVFGFIRNKNQERIVATAIVRAREIPDEAVRIYPDGDDIAFVASINNTPKVWTIYGPDSEWAQCNCPVGLQGMICKHTVKVFHLLHPEVSDGLIVREAGTQYGVNKSTPLSQCFTAEEPLPQSLQDIIGLDAEPIEGVDNVLPCQESGVTEDPDVTAAKLYRTLLDSANEHPELFDFLIADLKNARGKQAALLARGIAGVEHPEGPTVFMKAGGDNSLKRYRSFLEPKNRKVSRSRTSTK